MIYQKNVFYSANYDLVPIIGDQAQLGKQSAGNSSQ